MGKPSGLQSMGSQRVRNNLTTEQQQSLVGFWAGMKKNYPDRNRLCAEKRASRWGASQRRECSEGDGSVLGPLRNEEEAVWLVLGPGRLRDDGK